MTGLELLLHLVANLRETIHWRNFLNYIVYEMLHMPAYMLSAPIVRFLVVAYMDFRLDWFICVCIAKLKAFIPSREVA